ncbi:MAG: DUF3244 domain-containing protein [Prevotella sp.]|nr:DUF3244 domain-containing protein [Prevotella sp.]
MMRLLLAVMMMGLPIFQTEMFAGNIRVQTKKVNDNRKDEHKHLAPGHYSWLASAVWDEEIGSLSITFNAESDEVCVCIYKNDTLLIEDSLSVFEGYEATYDLSSYGDGDYQIVITGIGNDVLYGSFTK